MPTQTKPPVNHLGTIVFPENDLEHPSNLETKQDVEIMICECCGNQVEVKKTSWFAFCCKCENEYQKQYIPSWIKR